MSDRQRTRNISDYLNDILAAIEDIHEFTAGVEFADFHKDKKTVYAVIRCLEIIGEATKKIPADIRLQYPHIPWQAITGMRDKLIHDYFGVDVELVWVTVQGELDQFEDALKKIASTLQ